MFTAADLGTPKVKAFGRALAGRFPGLVIEPHRTRFDVSTAAELVALYDVVVDGSDNFATKFLANDAAVLAGRPLVHGAAVIMGGANADRARRRATVLPLPVRGAARARRGGPSCAEAGVLGPVPGVIGALQGLEAARILRQRNSRFRRASRPV